MSAKSPREEGDGMLTENRLSYSYRCASLPPPHPRGGEALPSNGLQGVCHWMGSHFYDWTDNNGVPFSSTFNRVPRMESHSRGGEGVLPHENDEGTRRKLSKTPLKVTRISFCGRGFEFIYTP